MATTTVRIFHLLVFTIYMYALFYDVMYNEVGKIGYGGKFRFLTYICLILQTAYFGFSVISDAFASNVRSSDLVTKRTCQQKFMDISMAAVVFPIGSFVVMTFWTIYAVDRELVYPKRLDALVPPWLNHIMHTTVLPYLVIEMYLVHHEYPSRRTGITILLAAALSYLLWILWVAYHSDFWVYPILRIMEGYQRVILIGLLLAVFVGIYVLSEFANNRIWRKEIQVGQEKLKVKKQH